HPIIAAPGHIFSAERAYCCGRLTSAPSARAACQPQCGSSSMARASATMSALPSATIASACFGVTIRPTLRVALAVSRVTPAGMGGRAARRRCDADVVARPGGMARLGGGAAGGDVDVVEPRLLEQLGTRDRIVRREPAVEPVAAGDARAERQPLRHHGAHRGG